MEKEGVVVKGRAIIDTRPPFRSVKEAVALFGEKVLVGEIYAKQFVKDKEIQASKVKSKKEEHLQVTPSPSPHKVQNGATTTQLHETKQTLKKTKQQQEEEEDYMVNCLRSLKEELEQTKSELHQLKSAKQALIIDQNPRNNQNNPLIMNPEIEEVKYIETNNYNNSNNNNNDNSVVSKRDIMEEDDHQEVHNKYKKFVSFASPPSLTRDITKNNITNNNNNNKNENNDNVGGEDYVKFGRTPSFRKEGNKKKPVIPIVGWLFSNKKNKDKYQYYASPSRSPTT